ncbi:hypothetical protein IKE67_08875 [bacterium]|nr:hypothetical protein [bacterium]
MTEIERLYKNAGINATARTEKVRQNLFECGLFYPDFTAEKQLKLIKWLAKIYELRIDWVEWNNSYRFEIRDYTNRRLSHSVCNCEEPFEETLAYLINRIWQSLTNQEKEEIRNILNA